MDQAVRPREEVVAVVVTIDVSVWMGPRYSGECWLE